MPVRGKRLGGLPLGMAAFFLASAPASGASAQGPAPLMEVKLRVYQAQCSSAQPSEVAAAIEGARALLEERCALRLLVQEGRSLGLQSEWCQLPIETQARTKALQRLSAQAKGQHARELALFLLPTSVDTRLSWAYVDNSLRSNCDSPQEPRFFGRFGSLFVTDLSWDLSAPAAGAAAPTMPSLLLAHEVLHALTQRGHPTGAPRGSVMADHYSDMGPAIEEGWCACARRSPYASPARKKR